MKKFLALVLSFSLITGSITPAFAQRPFRGMVPGTSSLIEKSLQTATQGEVLRLGSLTPQIYSTLSRQIFSTDLYSLRTKLNSNLTIFSSRPKALAAPAIFASRTETAMVGQLFDNALFLGIRGDRSDLPFLNRFHDTFKETPFADASALLLGRSMVNYGAYEEFNQFLLREKPAGNVWIDLKNIANQNGGNVTAPIVEQGSLGGSSDLSTRLQEYFGKFNYLGSLNADFSKEGTEVFLMFGKHKPLAQSSTQTEKAGSSSSDSSLTEASGQQTIEEGKPVFQPITLPVTLNKPVLEAPEKTSSYSTQVANIPSTQQGKAGDTSSTRDRFLSWLSPSSDRNADKQARAVLNKPQPLATHLRDIVIGNASNSLKIQALLKLYEQGFFKDFLDKQPANVKNNIINATEEQRGRTLLRLYQTKYLEEVLNQITDVVEQGSILDALERIVTQAGWKEEVERSYAAEDVLPLREGNFSGVVPSVPEADKEIIKNAVRFEGYAKKNASVGKVTKKGVYYENNIPFYYRNSKGELSSEPVGILTQVPASLYGRILSFMHLASQPGLTIPEGFVLAIDEKGQWKIVAPKGNLAAIEANPHSRKVLEQMNKEGSARVHLDTNYSPTDLLAIAHLLEVNPSLNFELSLNTPHSLNQFLTAHALFVGNDAGNTLTGPFKESLKNAAQGVVNMVTNLLGGVGYMTPIAGGYAMPTMARWGNKKTTEVIYGAAGLALAGSVFGLGMFGTVNPATLPLAALAIPTVALVLGASLANSFIPTFLNFYKDPAARTAANLDFSTKKQISRLALSGIVSLAALGGLNWTIVAPIGLGLLGISYALFRNTPMYREKGVVTKAKDPNEATYIEAYKEFRKNLPEMQAIKSRVKMVYASYAASLMILGQSANAVLPGGWGQGFITACMLATLGVRMAATKLVKKNIMTDDQLTGLSLPTLALSGAALALLPFSGPLAALTGLAGILHYMATAVPGQLDAARMQNIVTAKMQELKQDVLSNETLTEAEKEAAIKQLEAEEKVWSAQASKDYSLYNSRGLWGIFVAAAAAFLFEDLGPQWTHDILETISNVYGESSSGLALDRLLFGYSAGVAGLLALKNMNLTRDGINFFRKKKPITAENIANQKITPREFSINKNNATMMLGSLTSPKSGEIKELENLLMGVYGMYSEQKLTNILIRLQRVHNRLVAISEVAGSEVVQQAFQREEKMLVKFRKIMELPQSDFSVMLHRELDKFEKALFTPEKKLRQDPSYVEENIYKLPKDYGSYESARRVLDEMDQMAYTLSSGTPIDYKKFVDYMLRAREDLLTYEKANTADSKRVNELRRKMDQLCVWLNEQDSQKGFLTILPSDGPNVREGKQAMRDMLDGPDTGN